jgi:hypothetical protein
MDRVCNVCQCSGGEIVCPDEVCAWALDVVDGFVTCMSSASTITTSMLESISPALTVDRPTGSNIFMILGIFVTLVSMVATCICHIKSRRRVERLERQLERAAENFETARAM